MTRKLGELFDFSLDKALDKQRYEQDLIEFYQLLPLHKLSDLSTASDSILRQSSIV